MKPLTKHLVIAAGGTGGHFYPTLAIARAFKEAGGKVTLVVAGQHMSQHLALARENGLPAEAVKAVRLPGNPVAGLLFPFRLAGAVFGARVRLHRMGAEAVLGMGSFAAAPACIAAVSLRIPLLLHEGNSWIGRANRFLSRFARSLATSLPLVPGQNYGCANSRTGMPLREALLHAAENRLLPDGYFQELGLMPGRPILLVFGGSQGAQALNELLGEVSGRLGDDAKRFQVIHLTGTDENDALKAAYDQAGLRAVVRKVDSHIENCYLAADLVLCRAGASTISELALFGKPAVLVPLPTAAEDHQTHNAQMMARRNAARLLPQAEATPERVTELLRDWLANPRPWHELGHNIQKMACPDAAQAVVRMIRQNTEE